MAAPVYKAATSGTSGSLKVTLANTIPTGVIQVDEVATITLQVANNAAPTAADFAVSSVSVIDAVIYNTINGIGASVANVTLQ